MTEQETMAAVDVIAEDGTPITAHTLAKQLLDGPDVPVVLALDGPDPGECSPLDWAGVMGFYPVNGGHGTVLDWDPEDEPGAEEPDPGVVKAVVLGPRGLHDEHRCDSCGGSGVDSNVE